MQRVDRGGQRPDAVHAAADERFGLVARCAEDRVPADGRVVQARRSVAARLQRRSVRAGTTLAVVVESQDVEPEVDDLFFNSDDEETLGDLENIDTLSEEDE